MAAEPWRAALHAGSTCILVMATVNRHRISAGVDAPECGQAPVMADHHPDLLVPPRRMGQRMLPDQLFGSLPCRLRPRPQSDRLLTDFLPTCRLGVGQQSHQPTHSTRSGSSSPPGSRTVPHAQTPLQDLHNSPVTYSDARQHHPGKSAQLPSRTEFADPLGRCLTVVTVQALHRS